MSRHNGHCEGPWSRLEEAAASLDVRLVDSPRSGCRRLAADWLAADVDITPSSSMSRFNFVMPVSVGGDREAAPPGDQRDGAAEAFGTKATVLLATQDKLELGRIADGGPAYVAMWELNVTDDQDTVNECLRLLLADVASVTNLMAPSTPDGDRSPRTATNTDQPGPASSLSAVERWLNDSASSKWHVNDRDDGWRLVRAAGLSSMLPPVCEIEPRTSVLRAGTIVWLPQDLTSANLDGLAAYLLRLNGKMALRFGLRTDSSTGQSLAVIERSIPLVGLRAESIDHAISALVVGYQETHREIGALCNPEVAQWASLCFQYSELVHPTADDRKRAQQ